MNKIPLFPVKKLTDKQNKRKTELLSKPVSQISIKNNENLTHLIDDFANTSFQARNLGKASQLYYKQIKKGNTIIWSLAGSIFSAGLRQIVIDSLNSKLVDALVCTGALFEQDMLEALGHHHYICKPEQNDGELHELYIDRVYDHLLDELALQQVDLTFKKIAKEMVVKHYSSREFMRYCGDWLSKTENIKNSVMQTAYENKVPIFIPAINDCSIGIGIAMQQNEDQNTMSIDSIKDLREIALMKDKAGDTGIVVIGGGVPKNYSQDAVVMAEMLGYNVNKHKFGIQISTADVRDGGLSGSTLKEAISWGKNDKKMKEIMVWGEATVYFPLMMNYVYYKMKNEKRKTRELTKHFESN